jgi:molybdate transport system substrate-binding protein
MFRSDASGKRRLPVVKAALVFLLACVPSAHAAEIRCACAEAIRPILAELGPKFEQATGHKLVLTYGLAPQVLKRIQSGEEFDIAIINPPQADALAKEGKIDGRTRANLGRTGVGMAVRAGASKPDISTVDAFTRTLLNAKAVAFADEGTSGAYFRGVLNRLGITEQMKEKVRPAAAGANFTMVASGEAETSMGIIPQILAAPGVELVGPVPAELQTWIGLVAALGRDAKDAAAAKTLIDFLTNPAAMAVMKAKGWELIP